MADRPPSSEDADLIQRMQGGDQQSLDMILQAYGAAVSGLLGQRYASVLGACDIDDILSIALFRLWQSRHRKQQRGSLRAWFFRIADNVARDVLRRGWHKARRLEVQPGDDLCTRSEDADSTATLPAAEASPSDWQRVVREIVEQLPEVQRRIVWADALTRDGPANSTALAAELGIAPASVRVYRKRALEKIRTELVQRGFPIDESRMCHDPIS